MNFGLRDGDLDNIITTLRQFSEIEKAAIFGSRAKGNFKPGFDLDIAIWGKDISYWTMGNRSIAYNPRD